MGLYTSKEEHYVQALPDSVATEIPENIVIIKTDENKYIIVPEFTINTNDNSITIKLVDKNAKGIPGYVFDKIYSGSTVYRPGKLPLTNFHIISVETDVPGGGIGFLITWGAIRDIRCSFFVKAEFMGAEVDVTYFLSHHITPEIKKQYMPSDATLGGGANYSSMIFMRPILTP